MYGVEDADDSVKAQLRGLAFASTYLELVFSTVLIADTSKGALLISKRLGNKGKS